MMGMGMLWALVTDPPPKVDDGDGDVVGSGYIGFLWVVMPITSLPLPLPPLCCPVLLLMVVM
ncbi:hypothetical protein M8C21_005692 [Ambrosia artemisiifolia]|uniref:Uncharacterized protein n=1 Tax=Ambrosia artemisiifolia TaxID=4212 RepID=A0AAD5BRL5_AMBAR|nr:hypothetical protein M8C21_005692 [Ambrosia artemisiifolia]